MSKMPVLLRRSGAPPRARRSPRPARRARRGPGRGSPAPDPPQRWRPIRPRRRSPTRRPGATRRSGRHPSASRPGRRGRARARPTAARSGPAGRPRGARPAPPRCGPVSTGCSRSASGGTRPGPVARSRRSARGLAEPGDRLVAVAGVVGHPGRPSPKLDRVRQVGGVADVGRHARLEADGQAVLAAGRRVRVDRLGGLGRLDAGAERLRRPIGGQPVVGQLGRGPGRTRVGQLGSLGEHDGEAFVDPATLGRQEVAFEHLAQQGVARPKRSRGRIGDEDARP